MVRFTTNILNTDTSNTTSLGKDANDIKWISFLVNS